MTHRTARDTYIAALITDSSCTLGDTYIVVVGEADTHVKGVDDDGDEITELIMSDREVATIDTGIKLDDDIFDDDPVADLLDAAGWRIEGPPEIADNAYYYTVVPQQPELVAAPELPDEDVRKILAALNAWAARHRVHFERLQREGDWCGCNPFEDVIYGLDAFDAVKTAARFAEHEHKFVLVDGTEIVQKDGEDMEWTAARYGHDAESLRTGDPDDRPAVWTMRSDGTVLAFDGARWRDR